MHTSKRIRVGILLAITVISTIYAPFFVGHVLNATNPRVFNDDVRQQIFPYYRYSANSSSGQDMLGDYILAIMPIGTNFIYRTAAAFIDPALLSKALPYPLYILTLIGLSMTALRLGGPYSMLAVLALFIQTPTFFDRMTGGLSRAFGFPILSLALWALVTGRIRILAILVALATAFYPASGVVLGFVLAIVLILIPRAYRGEAATWSWKRRFLVLLMSAGASIVVLLPTVLALRQWGSSLGPDHQIEFPESGPSGRYDRNGWPDKRFLFRNVLTELLVETQSALRSHNPPSVPELHELIEGAEPFLIRLLLAYLSICAVALATKKTPARCLLALPIAGILGYLIAVTLAPYVYLPQRYITLTIPLTFVMFLPLGTAEIARLLVPAIWSERAKTYGALLATVIIIAFFGSRGNPLTGYTVVLDSQTNIYEFIRGLPRDSMIAGWPSGVLDNIPYYCRRRAFLTYENHHALHERYVLEMRRRMQILVKALFSEDPRFLAKLYDEFGVTHLIVDADSYLKAPRYFAPFDSEVKAVWELGATAGFAVKGLGEKAVVYREGKFTIFDLSLLKTENDRL